MLVPASGSSPYPELRSGSAVYRWQDGDVASIGDDLRSAEVCGADVADGAGLRGIDQSGVSADGETVVLTNRACADPVLRTPDDRAVDHLRHVLVWRDGETLDVSAPIAGADADAAYVGNAADGSAVFFTTAAQLEPDDDNEVTDLYRYDVDSGELTRPSANATAGGAAVAGAISSDDGRGAWSAAGGTLWSWTADGGRARGIASAPAGALEFKPVVTTSDQTTQISQDGRVLVWFSTARLGGHRGSAAQILRATADGDVDCVSCRPDGSDVDASFGYAPSGWGAPQPRISADGAHIFFATSAALSPDDVNGVVDIYGWHDGVVSLISGGVLPRSAEMNGVSRDGAVFFKDMTPLLPWIADEHTKIYTARSGGGFPAAGGGDAGLRRGRLPGAGAPVRSTAAAGQRVAHRPGRRRRAGAAVAGRPGGLARQAVGAGEAPARGRPRDRAAGPRDRARPRHGDGESADRHPLGARRLRRRDAEAGRARDAVAAAGQAGAHDAGAPRRAEACGSRSCTPAPPASRARPSC